MYSRFYFKLILATSVLFFFGLPTTAGAEGSRKKRVTPVKVERIIRRNVKPSIILIGTAEPSMKSTVASEVEGLVINFSVRLGQWIKKGETLAKIKQTPFSLELKQAQASLAEANENFKSALSELKSTEELFRKKTISNQ